MSEWRTFDSAPQTGDVILVYRPDAGVFTALYAEEDWFLATAEHPPEGECFWFASTGEDLTEDLPTHWQPLPAPPTVAA